MCHAKSEGGQRCAPHALRTLSNAAQRISAAPDDPRRQAAYVNALVDYASTPEGEQRLTAKAATSSPEVAASLNAAIAEGLSRREAAAAIRRAAVQRAADQVYDTRCAPELVDLAGESDDQDTREQVARHAGAPAATLTRLAEDPAPKVRATVAANPHTPDGTVSHLASDPSAQVRREVAAREYDRPVEGLGPLAGDDDHMVRWELASNTTTDPDHLTRLAGDPDHEVRAAVASNRSTAPELLISLASDPDSYVRDNAARNPRTPAHALEELSADQDPAVRAGAAANWKTPPAALTRLAWDPDPTVRASAETNPRVPAKVVSSVSA